MPATIAASMQVRPSFLYIGADRCGSKSLHNMFRQHPECYVPPIADPYYFDKNYDRGKAWYLSLFADAPKSARAIGEFSHDYIHSAEAARRIADDFPDIKLLATLRHPIERTFSSYASARAAGVIRTSFEQALEEVPMLIGNSLYADKLETYFDLFDRERIKILFFDDLERDPRAFAAEAFEFVDLPFVDEIDYDTRLSQLSSSKFPLAGALTKQTANFLRRVGWLNVLGYAKSNPLVRSLFYKPYSAESKPKVAPATRKRLQQVFAPQLDRLETLLDRDLSPWRI